MEDLEQPEEKRMFRRHAHAGEVRVGLPGEPSLAGGTLINLSLGGCMIHLAGQYDIKKGTRIEMAFKSSHLTFRSLGLIRRCKVREGEPTVLGVEFVDLAGRGRANLAELIEELELE